MKTEHLIILGTLAAITAVTIYAINQNYNVEMKAFGLKVNLNQNRIS